MNVVLDSSAIVAMFKGERGAENVELALNGARVSAVNLAETLSKLANFGFDPKGVEDRLRRAGTVVEPFVAEDIDHVVGLHGLASKGVSLADRICLALALRLDLPCMTGDRPWKALGLPIELRSFR